MRNLAATIVGSLIAAVIAILAIFVLGSLGWSLLWGIIGAFLSAVLVGGAAGFGVRRLLKPKGER